MYGDSWQKVYQGDWPVELKSLRQIIKFNPSQVLKARVWNLVRMCFRKSEPWLEKLDATYDNFEHVDKKLKAKHYS